jgi:hypothetical protein
VDVVNKKCESCQLKLPSFGLPAEGKARWCAGCAKAHAGAISFASNKKCEGCGEKGAYFGQPSEGVRWCAGCAKGHAGAEDVSRKKCEGCQLKWPSFGLPSEGKRRWCGGCAKGHAGAVSSQKCEGCRLKLASFGLPSGGKKRRWCGDCAPKAASSWRARAKDGQHETHTLTTNSQHARWETQLAKLEQYKCEHGDCNVPPVYDPRLNKWVNNQRARKKKLDRGEPSRGMTAARAAKLEALGFAWELSAAAVIRQMRRAGTADFNPRRRLPREPKATALPLTALTTADLRTSVRGPDIAW